MSTGKSNSPPGQGQQSPSLSSPLARRQNSLWRKTAADEGGVSSTGLRSLVIPIHYSFDQGTKSASSKPTRHTGRRQRWRLARKLYTSALGIFILHLYFYEHWEDNSWLFHSPILLLAKNIFKSAERRLWGKMRQFKCSILWRTIKKCLKFPGFIKHNGPCLLLRAV